MATIMGSTRTILQPSSRIKDSAPSSKSDNITTQIVADELKLTSTNKITNISSNNNYISFNENQTTTISTEYNLNGQTLVLPANCILNFTDDGKILNGTLVGSNTTIIANKKIFFDVNVEGTFNCVGQVKWFANGSSVFETEKHVCYVRDKVDESAELQKALDSAFRELIFDPIPYYIGSTLVLSKEKKLILTGSSAKVSMENCQQMIKNTCFIFSDKNITLLSIQANECVKYQKSIIIEGGNFDVSLCSNYTKSCIEVLAHNNEKIWGLTINTNIKGKYNNKTGIGLDINPVENKAMAGNNAFVTQIRINSNIQDFGIGIKATNYMDTATSKYYNWVTDLVIDGYIGNCVTCIDTNADCDIRAMLQAGYYYKTKENDGALVKFSGVRGSMCSNIYDILGGDSSKGYAQRYAVDVTSDNGKLVPYGLFNSFLIESRFLNKPVIKGQIYNNVTQKITNAVA